MKRNKALKEMAAAFKESMGVDPEAPTGEKLKQAMEAVLSELESEGMAPPSFYKTSNYPSPSPGFAMYEVKGWVREWENEDET